MVQLMISILAIALGMGYIAYARVHRSSRGYFGAPQTLLIGVLAIVGGVVGIARSL